MKISIKHYGYSSFKPSKIIEIHIEGTGVKVNEYLTDLYGKVDESFIENLEDIVNELKEQNQKIKNENIF